MILQINDTELVSSRFQVRYTTLKYLCKFKINIQDNITSLTYWFFKRKKFINTIKLLSLTNNYITSCNLKFVYGKIIQGIRSKVWEHGIYRENWIARGKSFDKTVKLIGWCRLFTCQWSSSREVCFVLQVLSLGLRTYETRSWWQLSSQFPHYSET